MPESETILPEDNIEEPEFWETRAERMERDSGDLASEVAHLNGTLCRMMAAFLREANRA